MALLSVKITTDNITHEFLKIDKNKKSIKSRLFIIIGQDKVSKQIIYYLPSLEISGYGTTAKKVLNMLNECVEEFYNNLLSLSYPQIQKELSGLGWIHNTIRKKEYSKSFIDINGDLKNFNVEDKIQCGFIEV